MPIDDNYEEEISAEEFCQTKKSLKKWLYKSYIN